MLEGRPLVESAARLAAPEGLSVAAAVPLSDLADDRFDDWLARGYDGDMGYLARWRDQRTRPAEHFPPYRSVIVFLAPYGPEPAPDPSPSIGNISRYALGDDYHTVLKKKAYRVLDGLRELDPTIEGRALVDTAPLLEKVAAHRAGLGWQGKHTNVIREDAGSWFFLTELLVDRDVPAPEPAVDRCGLCRDCIDVCPTGAIVAPYVLDSRRCISYLTIELRGAIPVDLRRGIGHRIFGCDDCQEVCPWNRFAKESPIREFDVRERLRDTSLEAWMDMDVDAWRATFRRSAVKRAGFDGFKRNVAVALGCARDPATLPCLERAAGREAPLVRRHVAWAMGELGEAARASLEAWRAREMDPEVLGEIDVALEPRTS